jgi:hypothetical protein
MLSAPVSDSWEGLERRGAIGDAIFGKKFFPAYAHPPPPPLSTLRERGRRKLFFGNRLDTLPRWSPVSMEAQACAIEAVSARVRRPRRLTLCTTYLRDLSRIAHAHARNPNDSRLRQSTPTACIWLNELKRFLSGGSGLHHSVMTIASSRNRRLQHRMRTTCGG